MLYYIYIILCLFVIPIQLTVLIMDFAGYGKIPYNVTVKIRNLESTNLQCLKILMGLWRLWTYVSGLVRVLIVQQYFTAENRWFDSKSATKKAMYPFQNRTYIFAHT